VLVVRLLITHSHNPFVREYLMTVAIGFKLADFEKRALMFVQ